MILLGALVVLLHLCRRNLDFLDRLIDSIDPLQVWDLSLSAGGTSIEAPQTSSGSVWVNKYIRFIYLFIIAYSRNVLILKLLHLTDSQFSITDTVR